MLDDELREASVKVCGFLGERGDADLAFRLANRLLWWDAQEPSNDSSSSSTAETSTEDEHGQPSD